MGWGLFQIAGPQQHVPLFRSIGFEHNHVPRTGWTHTEAVQITDSSVQPHMTVTDNLPWRAGASLFRATPEELRPAGLQEAINDLAALKPSASNVVPTGS